MNGTAAYGRVYLAFNDGRRGVGTPASFDGTHLDPVTISRPSGVSAGADSADDGDVGAGVRYGVVLYMTREGSLTAPQLPFSWVAAGGKKITVSNLPIGSAQVAARVVAFTVAGGTSAGPYFYIGEAQSVNGVSETSTIVADNSSTSATFNFDDAFLASSNEISDQSRAIELPAMAGAVFSETTQRLLWWGDPAQPSVVQCSQPNDAGNYYGDTGLFQVAENNGQRITAVFEHRNQIYVGKQDSLHLVTPSDGEPVTWSIQQLSPSTGICGARAVAVGDGVALFVHRTGVYQFDGGTPVLISDELFGAAPDRPGLWERINWEKEGQIWVAIDHEAKCVRIGVPLDGSTTCSHILKLSYLDGWERSFSYSPYTARYHYTPGRRWSVDAIAASQAVRIKRPLSLPATAADRRLGQSQILMASAGADGRIVYLDPGSALDDGQPIAWRLCTGAFSAAQMLRQQRQGLEMIGLIQMRAQGRGSVIAEHVTDGRAPVKFAAWRLEDSAAGDQCGMAWTQGAAVAVRLSNQNAPAALHLTALYVFARPSWLFRAGA